MEIKICGITNLNDAMCVCTSGADAVGFIFYRESPRYVDPETARSIISKLPTDICKVGVFVNHDLSDVKEIFSHCGLTMIQLHGDESPGYCLQFPESVVIKGVSLKTENDLLVMKDYSVRAFLVDSREKGVYGGTGKKSNWELAVRVKSMYPLILAGGLSADNIVEAITSVAPHAVDINSGVEDSPGKKNAEKIKKIIEMVRKIDKGQPKEAQRYQPIFSGS
jgi:phosphoribosylanthranilate isomerase